MYRKHSWGCTDTPIWVSLLGWYQNHDRGRTGVRGRSVAATCTMSIEFERWHGAPGNVSSARTAWRRTHHAGETGLATRNPRIVVPPGGVPVLCTVAAHHEK